MTQAIDFPSAPMSEEYRQIETKYYDGLLAASHDCNSLTIFATYVREVPNLKVVSSKAKTSKLARLREAGLIGCLNDTGITSQNYKEEFYKDN